MSLPSTSPVCFVLTSIALTGGVERDAMKCIRALAELKRTVHVVAGFVRPGVKAALQDLPVVFHRIYAFPRPPSLSQLLIYLQARRIVTQLERAHPDMRIIAFEPNPLANCWIGATPSELWKMAKKRGGLSRSFKPGLSLWQGWSEKKLLSRADNILTYSQLARSWFLHHGVDAKRLRQVIIPTDLQRFTPMYPPITARQEILIIGTNPKLKGIDIALQAWKQLAPHYPDLTLRIVCKGWKTPTLVKASGIDRVVVSPFIATPECYYTDARLVLMPSMYESWGNVPLEALACGVPVVVSRQTPSSMIVTAPWLGTTIDRDGMQDAEKLADAMITQLERTDEDSTMQQRHQYVRDFMNQYETTISWLLAHV